MNTGFFRRILPVLSCLAAATAVRAAETVDVSINPRLRHQTVEGWGASLCWWAHMVGRWDDEKKIDEIIDLIVSPDKLNMNIFRYNIGGGDDPSHYSRPGAPGHMAAGKGVRAEMEGFKDSPGGAYDWTRDRGQIRIMLKIKEKRPDAIFEAFSNSPPWWMTVSGCASGNDPGTADNLAPRYYDAFCDYLVTVCKHFKETHGIEFRTLEPFNESLTGYWRYRGGQEGCHFEPSTQIAIIKKLYPKLQASGLKTVISASDETSLTHFIRILNAYLDDGKVLEMIGQLNTHTYSATDSQRLTVDDLVRLTGKPFWQSETGTFEKKGFTSNLGLGQKCFDDMRFMKPRAWLDWQIVSPGDTWGTIRSNLVDEHYEPNRYFYVRMHVTRFIRQGYTIVDADQGNTLAAISPSGDRLVVCFINLTGKEKRLRCDLNSFRPTGPAGLYTTSATQSCEKAAPVRAGKDGHMEFDAADHTITTLIVPGKVKL
ncbi:hypothetical protein FACS1894159_08840 [Bacteroidia bacterium]|nr:hypothetical protein FACS1894159_08840 [Bacteroidia bacterium]